MHNEQGLRITGIFFLFCMAYLAIIVNLFLLQVRHASYFQELGQRQYQTVVTKFPDRGIITDRTGKIFLALNKMALSAFICPTRINDIVSIQTFLAKHFPRAAARLDAYRTKQFMYIKRNISTDEQTLIELANLPEICLLKEPHRYYPHADLASVVGVTNIDNRGVMGIELSLQEALCGQPQRFPVLKDARSGYFYFEADENIQTETNEPITLSIDANLQFLAFEQLQHTLQQYNAKQGSVLILDPTTGEIIVMANYPTFDPNNRSGLNLELTKNYCIAEQYELGSVMKVFTALAALQEEVTTIDEPIDCKMSKKIFIDGRRINTPVAHGILSFSQVIEKSNNIGTAIIAKRLNETLYEHLCRLGFGQKTDIELPGEQPGFINPPACWSKQSIISLSYGYELSSTLLQLACAFGLIANDGLPVRPTILLQKEPKSETIPLYDPLVIADIKEILQRTTLRGTAHRARMQGYNIMCKTGTANLLENGKYIHNKNSFTCAGIIEKESYKRIIITYIREVASDRQLYASQVAVPLFEQVAQKMLIHDRIV